MSDEQDKDTDERDVIILSRLTADSRAALKAGVGRLF